MSNRFLPRPRDARPPAGPGKERATGFNSLLDRIHVQESGERIILTGCEEAIMNCIVETLEREGAQAVRKPVKVGDKWVASFFNPRSGKCTVEKFGYRLVVTGPTRALVLAKSQELTDKGASVTHGPVEHTGQWKIYLED